MTSNKPDRLMEMVMRHSITMKQRNVRLGHRLLSTVRKTEEKLTRQLAHYDRMAGEVRRDMLSTKWHTESLNEYERSSQSVAEKLRAVELERKRLREEEQRRREEERSRTALYFTWARRAPPQQQTESSKEEEDQKQRRMKELRKRRRARYLSSTLMESIAMVPIQDAHLANDLVTRLTHDDFAGRRLPSSRSHQSSLSDDRSPEVAKKGHIVLLPDIQSHGREILVRQNRLKLAMGVRKNGINEIFDEERELLPPVPAGFVFSTGTTGEQ